MAISFFYAVGTAIGGISGPLLFGKLVASGDEGNVALGYALGAVLMIIGGVIQAVLGVEAAQKELEDIAKPLSAEDAEVLGAGAEGAAEDAGDDGRFSRGEASATDKTTPTGPGRRSER